MNEWVSVKERLPELNRFNDIVPCLVRIQRVFGGSLTDDFCYELAEFRSVRVTPSYFTIKTPGIVTHWMYAPEVEKDKIGKE